MLFYSVALDSIEASRFSSTFALFYKLQTEMTCSTALLNEERKRTIK